MSHSNAKHTKKRNAVQQKKRENAKTRKGCIHWRHTLIGRAVVRGTQLTFEARNPRCGVDGDFGGWDVQLPLWEALQDQHPEYAAMVLAKRGSVEEVLHVLWDRGHKGFWDNGKQLSGKNPRGVSDEHYSFDVKLHDNEVVRLADLLVRGKRKHRRDEDHKAYVDNEGDAHVFCGDVEYIYDPSTDICYSRTDEEDVAFPTHTIPYVPRGTFSDKDIL